MALARERLAAPAAVATGATGAVAGAGERVWKEKLILGKDRRSLSQQPESDLKIA